MTRNKYNTGLDFCISHKACDNLKNFKINCILFEKGVTAVTGTSQLVNL